MSYITIDKLEEIINKKVLFIDLETSGLIKNVKKNNKSENKYPNYKNNEDYDSSRIVQLGYIYLEDFDYDYEIKPVNIKSVIIKPEGFVIPGESIKIYGITNKLSNEKGKNIKKELKKIKKIISEVEYIIGYNIYFDINILLNEFHRVGLKKPIIKIKELIEKENILCLGELSRQYKCYKNMPSQKQIYKELFNKSIENIHNAQYDICATIEIMYWYNENKKILIEKSASNNKLLNYGKKWNENEYNTLLDEITKNLDIDEICKNHKRNKGGIKSGIKRLIFQNPTDKIIKRYYENFFEQKNNFIDEKENIINNDNNIEVTNKLQELDEQIYSFTLTIPGTKKVYYCGKRRRYGTLNQSQQHKFLCELIKKVIKSEHFKYFNYIFEEHENDIITEKNKNKRLHVHGFMVVNKEFNKILPVEKFVQSFYEQEKIIGLEQNVYDKLSNIQKTYDNINYWINYINKNQNTIIYKSDYSINNM